MPTFTDEELKEHDDKLRADARALAEQETLKDTSWKSLEALKESALNADRKISDVVREKGEIEKKAQSLESRLKELGEKSSAGDDEPTKVIATIAGDDEPTKVIATMTEKEAKHLDALCKADKNLHEAIKQGGKEAKAKALTMLREKTPVDDDSGGLFSVELKRNANGTVDLDAMFDKANENYAKRHGLPAARRTSGTAALAGKNDDEDRSRPIRASGGALEFAADYEE